MEAETELGNVSCLSPQEIVHIGEEIADVFIYSVRLADLIGVDIAGCILYATSKTLEPSNLLRCSSDNWKDCSFEDLECTLLSNLRDYRSQRQLSLQLQYHVGMICLLFTARKESDNSFGLTNWSNGDLELLKASFGEIGRTLTALALMSNLRVGDVIARKFEKNAIKYPVELSRGSSAKYTVYANKINGDRKQLHVVLFALTVFVVGSSIHRFI